MTPEELEAYRNDPHNQKWGVYYCKADPRVIVPKRAKWMGWTLNTARPSAIPVLLVTAILTGPATIARALGAGNRGFLVAIVASVASCVCCAPICRQANDGFTDT